MNPSRCQLCAAPPGTSCASTTVTFLPYLARRAPAHRPPMPAPMTTTSVSWLLSVAAAARIIGEDLLGAMRRLPVARGAGEGRAGAAAKRDASIRGSGMSPKASVDPMTVGDERVRRRPRCSSVPSPRRRLSRITSTLGAREPVDLGPGRAFYPMTAVGAPVDTPAPHVKSGLETVGSARRIPQSRIPSSPGHPATYLPPRLFTRCPRR